MNKKSQKENRQFLIVGGCPRSGTTLLYNILNSHPKIKLLNEKNLDECLGDEMPNKRSELYLGTKLPQYYRELPLFISNNFKLKNIKFIHISRNPIPTIASMFYRTKKARLGSDLEWNPFFNLSDHKNEWMVSWNYALSQKNNSDFLHLKYEDLVKNPQSVLKTIASFINIEQNFDISDIDSNKKMRGISHNENEYLNKFFSDISSDWERYSLQDLENTYTKLTSSWYYEFRRKINLRLQRIFAPNTFTQ